MTLGATPDLSQLTRFYVSAFNKYVTVMSKWGHVGSVLDSEIGGFFDVSSDCPEGECLGEIVHIASEAAYRNALRDAQMVATKRFMMHDPKNTPKERRSGKKGVTADGDVVVISLSRESVFFARKDQRRVYAYNADKEKAPKEIRRIIRDQIFVRFLESRGAVTIHSAAIVCASGVGALVVGSSGAGKTSFFMQSIAMTNTRFGLSCERTLVIPTDDGLRLHPVPEKINFFAGTLRQYKRTSQLAGNISSENEWVRREKLKIPWRKVFEAFDVMPIEHPIYLSTTIFPKYGDYHAAIELSAEDGAKKISSELLTYMDSIRPNWLGWYCPNKVKCELTVTKMLKKQMLSVGWRNSTDINILIGTLANAG